jgi:hypothetical protein
MSGECSSVGRAPDCGSGCRGFEPRHSPQNLRLKSKGIVTTKELIKHKISEATLSRLVKSGQLERITKGLYIHPESSVIKPEDFDFVFACTKIWQGCCSGRYYCSIPLWPNRASTYSNLGYRKKKNKNKR